MLSHIVVEPLHRDLGLRCGRHREAVEPEAIADDSRIVLRRRPADGELSRRHRSKPDSANRTRGSIVPVLLLGVERRRARTTGLRLGRPLPPVNCWPDHRDRPSASQSRDPSARVRGLACPVVD